MAFTGSSSRGMVRELRFVRLQIASARPIAARIEPVRRPMLRHYSRDPRQAEEEASTVRGHRVERARTESGGASSSSTASSSSSGGAGQQEYKEGRSYEGASLGAKLANAWNSTPIKWYPIPVLLGACVLVGVQARRNYVRDRREERGTKAKIVDENGKVVTMQGPWTVYVLGALPLNAISRAWGWANGLTLPVWFRPFGFRLYARIFGCNLDEMKDTDLTHYKSLGEFFYRELKEGARPIDDAPLVSPADGTVLHFGTIKGRRVEQVKGVTYSLDALLGLTSDPQGIETNSGRPEAARGGIDERQFASVNGIEYSLDRLLGDDEKTKEGKPRWRVASWKWWKSWVVSSSKGPASTTGIPASHPARAPPTGPSQEPTKSSTKPVNEADEEEAGVPTPDTPEVLGRYANVAYDMGSGALPPILQRHSPGREGVAEENDLFFCVIYLAPGDYHRFHSPTSWVAERRRHFRGELYSVSPYVASRLSNLFVLNERVALLGRWRHGFFGMVPVGATNVGSIRINFDKALRTNVRDQRRLAGTYSEATYASASMLLGGQPLIRGEEMGGFLLGSTIVLVFEAPKEFDFDLEDGQKIKVGQKLGDITPK